MRLLLLAVSLAALGACASPDRAASDDPNRCASCHMADYAAVKHPLHAGAKPTTCGVCHTPTAWHPSRIDHPFFALTEGHAKPGCFDCHRGAPPVFHGLGKACVGCHRTDFDRAKFPGHAEFPLTCEECHTTTKWKPSTWKTLPAAAPSASAVTPPEPATKPKPGAPKPKPKPKPAPTSSAPDVITRPSWRAH